MQDLIVRFFSVLSVFVYLHIIQGCKETRQFGKRVSRPRSFETRSEMVIIPESRMVACYLSEVGSLGLVPYCHEPQFGGGGRTLAIIDCLILHTAPEWWSWFQTEWHSPVHAGHMQKSVFSSLHGHHNGLQSSKSVFRKEKTDMPFQKQGEGKNCILWKLNYNFFFLFLWRRLY